MSDDRAPLVMGLAYVACLTLLWDVAPAGELIVGGAVLALALAAWPEPRPQPPGAVLGWGRVRRRWGLPAILSVVTAASAGVAALLRLLLEPDPAGVVAWFARALCLGGAATVVRTPPAALSLHGLVVLLGAWTATALDSGPALGPRTLLLTLVTLTCLAAALLRARSHELQRAAAASYTIGVAPTPWGARRAKAPVAVVALVALLPWALGVELPRALPRALPGAGAPRGSSPSAAPPAAARISFAPALRVDQARDHLETPQTIVARVRAAPSAPTLLLRGAVLERADDDGFFAAAAAPPDPLPRTAARRALEVELLRALEGCLLATGPLERIDGAAVDATPAGPRLRGDPSFPLRYTARCLEPAGTYARDDLHALDRPQAVELPAAVRGDPVLGRLAEEVAWGRTPLARARHALSWLQERCVYDPRHPVAGGDLATRVRRFLGEDRRGICLEFAASLAVLLRLVDVPARVVTGYRAHEQDAGGAFVVRSAHAHAWVEVGLTGAGWVPLDPTPAAAAEAFTASGAAELEAAAPDAPARALGVAPPSGPALGALLALVAAGVAAAGALNGHRVRAAVRRAHLGRDPVPTPALTGARARLFAALARRGFELDGSETPLEFLDRLAEAGGGEPALSEAVALYTRLRFSGRSTPAEREALARGVRRL